MTVLPKKISYGGQDYVIPVTVLDRVINFFDPHKGLLRYRQRAQLALFGAYSGVDRTRRANQAGNKPELDATGAITSDLSFLRSTSQDLFRNNAIAGGALLTNITKVVGTGLKVKAQIDGKSLGLSDEQVAEYERKFEKEFCLATDTVEIDSERQQNFSQLQALAFLKVLEDGDVVSNLPRFARPGSPYKLKIQLIEAARLSNPDGQANSEKLTDGVETDENGAPAIYHVASRHPGSYRYGQKNEITWQHLKAFGNSGAPLCLHLFDKRRPGQRRGVPYLAPVIELIKQLGRYTDAEVMAAVVGGYLTAAVTNDTGSPIVGPAPTLTNPDGSQSKQVDVTGLELGYGTVIGLTAGDKIETIAANRPNPAFDPFMTSILRQIGMALELPFEILIKHFTASYSAARAAMEEAWDYFNRRRSWLVFSFCQPIYEAIINEAVATGRLAAPGFFADPLIKKAWLGTVWNGDAQSQIDPVKEAEAARMRIYDLHISTHAEECAKLTGGDFEAKLPQLSREIKALREAEVFDVPTSVRKTITEQEADPMTSPQE